MTHDGTRGLVQDYVGKSLIPMQGHNPECKNQCTCYMKGVAGKDVEGAMKSLASQHAPMLVKYAEVKKDRVPKGRRELQTN